MFSIDLRSYHTVLSFGSADSFARGRKPTRADPRRWSLAGNGRASAPIHLVRNGDESYSVEYHRTAVVRYYPDGSVAIATGGWGHNRSTRAVLYSYAPLWLDLITGPKITVLGREIALPDDPVRFWPDGSVSGAVEQLEKNVDKEVINRDKAKALRAEYRTQHASDIEFLKALDTMNLWPTSEWPDLEIVRTYLDTCGFRRTVVPYTWHTPTAGHIIKRNLEKYLRDNGAYDTITTRIAHEWKIHE